MAKINDGFQQRKVIEEPSHNFIEVRIRLYEDGALSVQGPVGFDQYVLQTLENALDAWKNKINGRPQIIVPARDVSITAPGPEMPSKGSG